MTLTIEEILYIRTNRKRRTIEELSKLLYISPDAIKALLNEDHFSDRVKVTFT
jgi:hypothetical protein